MGTHNYLAFLLDFAAIIVVSSLLIFAVRTFLLCWKHDSYIQKTFPELSKEESVSVLGGNWNGIRILKNIFSKNPPDEYVYIMRKKIRHSWCGMLLSISLLPMALFLLIVIIMVAAHILGYSL